MHPYEKNHIFQFGIRKQIDSSKEILNNENNVRRLKLIEKIKILLFSYLI